MCVWAANKLYAVPAHACYQGEQQTCLLMCSARSPVRLSGLFYRDVSTGLLANTTLSGKNHGQGQDTLYGPATPTGHKKNTANQ